MQSSAFATSLWVRWRPLQRVPVLRHLYILYGRSAGCCRSNKPAGIDGAFVVAQAEENSLLKTHPLYMALDSGDEARKKAYRELFRFKLDPGWVDEIRSQRRGTTPSAPDDEAEDSRVPSCVQWET